MIKPLNNHCLVEVIDKYGSVLHNDTDKQYQKGKLVDCNFYSWHLTTSTGVFMDNVADNEEIFESMLGKIVYWQQYADSGQVFDIDKKKYALIPFYRLVGVEE